MKDKDSKGPARPAEKPKRAEFVGQMFSGFGHPSRLPLPPHHPAPPREYHPLPQSKGRVGARYYLRRPTPVTPVKSDSPAIEVMTDLGRVTAVTTRLLTTIDEANRTMIGYGVRALFVVDDERAVLGIITSTDILGERPMQIVEQHGVRHDEVLVRDVMTPADRLEAMTLEDVLQARVGDVVATLRQSGRQHALVIERDAGSERHTVRGIFSLTQIARQLGLPPLAAHDIGRTFLEVEAAIGS